MGDYSAVVTELGTRLTYHATTATPARILNGFQLRLSAVRETVGQRDHPFVELYGVEGNEEYVPNDLLKATLTVQLVVGTLRSDGPTGHLAAVEKVLDAIETNSSGVLDPSLNRKLISRLEMNFSASSETDLTMNSIVTVRMMLHPQSRGARRT